MSAMRWEAAALGPRFRGDDDIGGGDDGIRGGDDDISGGDDERLGVAP